MPAALSERLTEAAEHDERLRPYVQFLNYRGSVPVNLVEDSLTELGIAGRDASGGEPSEF